MKKLLLILGIVVAFLIDAKSQEVYKSFTEDTVQGAETIYFAIPRKIVKHTGVVSFSFTKADIADSLSLCRMHGANMSDYTDAQNLTGNAALTLTTTDGSTILYVEDPKYIYYRLATTCAAGDTVRVYNVYGVYKED